MKPGAKNMAVPWASRMVEVRCCIELENVIAHGAHAQEGILESYRLVSQVMRPGAKNMTIPRVTKTAMTPQTILRALRVRLWKRKLIG
jgi:hypothetical protein